MLSLVNSVVGSLLDGGKLLERFADDIKRLAKIRLGDDERRREANDVSVRGLGLFIQTLAIMTGKWGRGRGEK